MSTPFEWINELADLSYSLPDFVTKITQLAADLGVNIHDYPADHIAVRCHSQETAARWHQGLLQAGEMLSQKNINGRPICLFALHQPLSVGPWVIDCIELPYPSEKHYLHEGWEHIELVVSVNAETITEMESAALHAIPSLSTWMSTASITSEIATVRYKASMPQAEDEQRTNPTLAFSRNGITLKIHPLSIRDVIGCHP
ncbi:MAG: VOC family protein [Plesiomonas sp.]|uniref:VOC family protein n=1 Tax=Plesiomonas sp. TaxID=2486279 RepID=UPI003F3411B7